MPTLANSLAQNNELDSFLHNVKYTRFEQFTSTYSCNTNSDDQNVNLFVAIDLFQWKKGIFLEMATLFAFQNQLKLVDRT